MRKITTLCLAAALLLLMSACSGDELVVTGTISGLPDDCRLMLINYDDDQDLDSLTTYADIEATENFTITAHLDGPTMLQLVLTMYDMSYDMQVPVAAISFMADNEKVTIDPVAFGSLVAYSQENTVEEHVKIHGGKVQEEYEEYLAAISEERQALSQVMDEGGEILMDAAMGMISEDNDSVRMYAQQIEDIQRQRDEKTLAFITAHPNYAISALLVSRSLHSMYRYSEPEIDGFLATIAKNPDQHRLDIARQNAEQAKKYALGRALGDEQVTMQNGAVAGLHDLLNADGMTLIDCWASWCAPCRNSIPKLKEISVKYADRLKIVSISCDQSEQDWRDALAIENMPWPQALLTLDQMNPFMSAYNVEFIPYLMLISDGKILVATNELERIEAYLQTHE